MLKLELVAAGGGGGISPVRTDPDLVLEQRVSSDQTRLYNTFDGKRIAISCFLTLIRGTLYTWVCIYNVCKKRKYILNIELMDIL